ncbi:phosphatase PAP2 family protein [Bosea sp. TAF32]|uniref:phosphatase PAP2 family protein n=1 Tax=Bosea sp. TAF32 TaxID=3237482 RepID=UPI003F8DDF68
MRRLRIPTLPTDQAIASVVASHATPKLERPLRAATLLADERFLCFAAVCFWLTTDPGTRDRKAANHIVRTTFVATILPHALKKCFAQERPDRIEVRGRRHGVPKSGDAYAAFPSGHAVHMAALASAVSRTFPRFTAIAWMAATAISFTRVALLAHWTSDVLAGGALGLAVESILNAMPRDEG